MWSCTCRNIHSSNARKTTSIARCRLLFRHSRWAARSTCRRSTDANRCRCRPALSRAPASSCAEKACRTSTAAGTAISTRSPASRSRRSSPRSRNTRSRNCTECCRRKSSTRMPTATRSRSSSASKTSLGSYPALDLTFAPGPGAGTLQDMLYAELDAFEPVAIQEHQAGDGWRVFFRSSADRDSARGALASEFGNALLRLVAVDIDDEDWARRSQATLRSVRVGRIIVSPPWDLNHSPLIANPESLIANLESEPEARSQQPAASTADPAPRIPDPELIT